MPNVYIEARPKGRQEGSGIDDFVVEDHADHVLATFKTQKVNVMSRISGRRSNTRRTRARWQPAVLKPVHGGTSRSQR
jgi:hypothetical protein